MIIETAAEMARAINLENQARMQEAAARGEDLWYGMLSEQAAHWAGYGIYTAEQLEDYLDDEDARWNEEGLDYHLSLIHI